MNARSEQQQIFTCPVHNFVIVLRGDELNSRGSPGRRDPNCATCDQAVNDAFDFGRGVSDV